MIALTLCGLMMASGSALAGLPSGDSDNNINTNPENDAGTQGTGGVVHFTGKITDASCNITTDSAGQTVELGTGLQATLPPKRDHAHAFPDFS